MLKIHRALMTIHMIGQNPNTAPSSAESAVCPTGIEYTMIAISIDTARAISEAHWAFILKPPRRTNRTTSGSTAKIAVSPREWDTGSSTCLYTWTSLRFPVPSECVRRLPTRDGGHLCNRLQAQREHLGGVQRAPAGARGDLRAARETVRNQQRVGGRRAHLGQQELLADRHRYLVLLAGVISE